MHGHAMDTCQVTVITQGVYLGFPVAALLSARLDVVTCTPVVPVFNLAFKHENLTISTHQCSINAPKPLSSHLHVELSYCERMPSLLTL